MFDDPRLLFANDWFYTAFNDRDLASMSDIWAKDHSVTCLHPGWEPLIGRDAVMASWKAILSNPDAPGIRHLQAQAFNPDGGKVAYVLCFEQIKDMYLSATNIFVLEDRDWRIVHHQAAPCAEPEDIGGEGETLLQ